MGPARHSTVSPLHTTTSTAAPAERQQAGDRDLGGGAEAAQVHVHSQNPQQEAPQSPQNTFGGERPAPHRKQGAGLLTTFS